MVYLGSTIHGNGRYGCEISRKIGAAAATFQNLQTVWKHTSISTSRKLQIFDSCIQSKMRYALASAWLLKADLRRLDGFQASCLRQVMGIPCSFISRMSNEKVREMSGMQQFSVAVKSMQLKLLGQVLTNPKKKQLKDVTFHRGTLESETSAFVRRIGRPRQNWTEQLLGCMRAAAGSQAKWEQATRSTSVWQEVSSSAL